MKVLAVKQPWAQLIIDGVKTIEVRSKNTNIRERVAIYATRSKPDYDALRETKEQLGGWIRIPDKYFLDMNTGVIVGTAMLYNSYEFGDFSWLLENNKHCVPDSRRQKYGWFLQDPLPFETPIPFKMKKGCVVWDSIDDSLLPATTGTMSYSLQVPT